MNQPQAEPTRFSLRWLLGMAALFCVALPVAAILESDLATLLVFVVLPITALLRFRAYKTAGVYALAFAAVAVLLLPLVSGAREAARRNYCNGQLKMLSLALLNYHDVHGSFPPAYFVDAQGKPAHSWRVLILPFMECDDIYQQYRFDEPWNGPHNSQLAAKCPNVFQCASDFKGSHVEMTSYVAVVGAETMWPNEKATTDADIRDGITKTVMLVEAADSGIHWMEPRDLDFAQMAPTINAPQGQGIRSHHPQGANVAWADGSVTFLAEAIEPSLLRALLTADGGENVQQP